MLDLSLVIDDHFFAIQFTDDSERPIKTVHFGT